jgi:hypothetical protein
MGGSDEALATRNDEELGKRGLRSRVPNDSGEGVVVWNPDQTFKKSDREGGIPQGKSLFRF